MAGTPHSERRRTGSWRTTTLFLAVHLDALLRYPVAYLAAQGWRLRGKRLRARNRIAPLTGKSPRAYAYWIARREPDQWAAQAPAPTSARASITFAVDCRANPELAGATLQSLGVAGACAPVLMIGDDGMRDLIDAQTDLTLKWHADPASLLRALEGGPSRWLCPIFAGDRLATGALDRYVAEIHKAGDAPLIYADDDLLGPRGERIEPHFKPEWNAELFRHHDFVSGAAAIRFAARPRDASADWVRALVDCAISESEHPPHHLPLVLHHRRRRPAPIRPQRTSPSPRIDSAAARVTVIVPTRNQLALLRTCLEGVAACGYSTFDCIVIDNDSDDAATLAYLADLAASGIAVLRFPGPFNFSAMNNAAAGMARGDYLCFLNNDIEMPAPGWLAPMVAQAQRADVGAVGARLLYPDGSVQHAGVVLGVGGGAGHAHRYLPAGDPGYFDRARLPQFTSAVTAACLVVAREKFLAVGGFDETVFRVAFNDVDLCLKLNARGWQTLYEPRATLVHHESKSRGLDLTPAKRARFEGELAALKTRWRTDRESDPFHHPQLSRFSEQFVVHI